MAVNIRQIAKIAGVAPSTISRATNPKTRHLLSDKTLKKIDALVKEHGYVPNIAARQLSKPGARTIGVILPYYGRMFYHSYYIHILAGIADALMDTDYSFKLILLKPQKKKWNWYDFQAGEGVEGIIVTHWQSFFSSRFMAKEQVLPHVVINDFDKRIKAYFVCEDSKMGGGLAAAYLHQAGHRNVGVITGASASRDSQLRLAGFLEYFAQKKQPVPASNVVEGDFGGRDKVLAAVDNLLQLNKRPTALFTCNDKIALTAIEHLKKNGVFCPKDISIVGYDNVEEASTASPPLTTIYQPLYDLAVAAVGILIDHLARTKGPRHLSGSTHLPVTLMKRKSVRKI